MTNFCKDCIYSVDQRDWLDRLFKAAPTNYMHCKHPAVLERDGGRQSEFLVTGISTETPFCSSARIAPCGPEGKLFEAKDKKL